ncbi:MAG: hypothetical protein HKN47_03740 [Pirellulaceae bacterium]|nr:hypothetical protein [Pirellulaceae bacterium]
MVLCSSVLAVLWFNDDVAAQPPSTNSEVEQSDNLDSIRTEPDTQAEVPTSRVDDDDTIARDDSDDDTDADLTVEAEKGQTDGGSPLSDGKIEDVEIRLPLPNRAPDGRLMRAVGVFQSQLVELVPRSFRPIAIDRLAKAIESAESESNTDDKTRLRSGFYDVRLVDNILISDRSTIDIETNREGIVRRGLGKVNLAILPARERSFFSATPLVENILPRLESSSSGELYAVINGSESQDRETTVNFSWSFQGKLQGMQREFDLELPRTTQTQIILSTPIDMVADCVDGVIRDWPGPPPGADVDTRDHDVRWYTIDAGGLSTLRLRIRRRTAPLDLVPIIVRDQTRSFEIDSAGVTWKHEMTIQSPGGRRLPEFVVPFGKVIAVKINNANVSYSTSTFSDLSQRIVIGTPISGDNAVINTVRLAISGSSTWDGETGWCDLPTTRWTGSNVLIANPMSDAQVVIRDPLTVVAWELPPKWNQQPQRKLLSQAGSDAAIELRAQGPPSVATTDLNGATTGDETDPLVIGATRPLDAVDDEQDTAVDRANRFWSRIRLATRPTVPSVDHWLQLKVSANASELDRVIEASSRMQFAIDQNRTTPIRIEVQPGWSLQSVSIANSGRVIESPAVNQRTQVFLLWPEPEDVADSTLVITATGSRRVPVASDIAELPEMWFLRVRNVVGTLLTAIVPPADLNWSGDSALRGKRLGREILTDPQRQFFDAYTDETLLFRPDRQSTPTLWLKRPGISIDVATSLQFERYGDEITESLVISAESNSQLIKQISVMSGPMQDRPEYRWSLRSSDGALPINLPSTDVQLTPDGLYTIDLGEASLRKQRLIGRRRYKISDQLTIQLPGVSSAASQDAEVVLGEGLAVTVRDQSVQRIPVETLSAQPSRAADTRFLGQTRLRYDAVKPSRIVLKKTDVDPSVSIVWHHQVYLTASSRGADLLRGSFRVSSKRPIQVDYEPDLQLVSLTHNNQAVDLATITERPIVLKPLTDNDSIRIVWSRERIESGWLRRCRIPKIQVKGVHLKSSYRMNASADTFALATLLQSTTDFDSSLIDVNPDKYKLLIHRDHALAFGWLVSLIVFIGSWFLARARLTLIALLVSLAGVSAVLWWPWQTAIVGWLIIPMVAAALLQSSIEWSMRKLRPSQTDDKTPEAQPTDDSREFSLATEVQTPRYPSPGLPVWFIIASVCWCGPEISVAADPPSIRQPVNVLVPLDAQARRVGDKVYVPDAFYQDLFNQAGSDEPSTVNFSSANYRVDLPSILESVESGGSPLIEAEFEVHVVGDNNRVRLPFAAQHIWRIEVRQGDRDRFVPTEAGDDQFVIATLPPGESFRIRATLIPTVKTTNGRSKLTLPIPKIAASRLLVESNRALVNVEIGSSQGRSTRDVGLRRWESELGNIDQLNIKFQSASSVQEVDANQLQRRYWISAGTELTTIDCQVEPSKSVKVGETIDLVILDSRLPTVTTAVWQIERSQLVSPSRWSMTLIKRAESDAPIGLLWTLPSPINDATSREDRIPLTIPEITSAVAGEFVPTAIAIQSAPELRVTHTGQNSVQDQSEQAFVSKWKGFPVGGSIDQAFVATTRMPSLVMLQSRRAEPTATTFNYLHVTRDELQLQFRAIVKPSDSLVQRRTLRFPATMDLVHLTVDGQPVRYHPIRSGTFIEVALGDFDGVEPRVIEALGLQPRRKGRRVALPAMQCLPKLPGPNTYSVMRSNDIQVQVSKQPTAMEFATPEATVKEFLAEGWVPVVNWDLPENIVDLSDLKGQVTASNRNTRFGCDQQIVMSYSEGGWSMESQIQFTKGAVPDYVDVEIPTRWTNSLSVSPQSTWIIRPSTDPGHQVIRIVCDRETLSQSPLFVRSELNTTDQGRVTVPKVSVLGVGPRKIAVSVPNRLTNDPIEWKLRAVTASGVSADASTYIVENDAWSIELAPLSGAKSDPVALAADTQVFLQSDKAVIICRWDLVPNGLESVEIRLPERAKCLGAWTAGSPVLFEPVYNVPPVSANSDSETASSGGSAAPQAQSDQLQDVRVIRVPLSLSRLAQPVEILLSIPILNARRTDYLPELRGISVPDQWVATYVPIESAPLNDQAETVDAEPSVVAELPMSNLRAISLASVVIDAVDQSLDTLAERPANEVATWLLPWVTRYQSIAEAAGHSFVIGQTVQITDDEDDALVQDEDFERFPQLSVIDAYTIERFWLQMDRRMQSYVDRYLVGEHLVQKAKFKPLFDPREFTGYRMTDAIKVTPAVRPRSIQAMSSGMHNLRNTLSNLLTLGMVGGLLLILKPFRKFCQGLCLHPAFWMSLTGIFGLFVAPMPVALAVVLVAATLPWMPRH